MSDKPEIDGKAARKRLTELRKRFPLPDGVPDATINKKEIAAFLATTTVTLDSWLSQGLPALERGTNGREWKFRAADVWAWKCSRDAQEVADSDTAARTIQAMRLALIGGGTGKSIDGLSPRDKREVIATQMEHEKFQRERNELLRREDVRDAFEIVFSAIRDGLDALPDELHRELSLSPGHIEQASLICDRILAGVKNGIEQFFNDRPKAKARKENLFDMN